MKASTREALLDGLSRVVQGGEGTAHTARVAGIEVLGKTGTVQVIRQKKAIKSEDLAYQFRDHAWFVASAPRENPKIALAIFVEHGGHGGSAAAPLAAKMIRAWLTDSWPAPQPLPAEPPPMPDPLPDDERPAVASASPAAVEAAAPPPPGRASGLGGTP